MRRQPGYVVRYEGMGRALDGPCATGLSLFPYAKLGHIAADVFVGLTLSLAKRSSARKRTRRFRGVTSLQPTSVCRRLARLLEAVLLHGFTQPARFLSNQTAYPSLIRCLRIGVVPARARRSAGPASVRGKFCAGGCVGSWATVELL